MPDEDFRDRRRAGDDGLEDARAEFEPRRGAGLSGAGGAPRMSALTCPNCGYNLTGATIGMPCPECASIVGQGLLGADQRSTSGYAVASLVLGILGLVGCFAWGLPSMVCGPLAIVFARMTRRQIARGEAGSGSAGVATAGMVLGIIGTILGVVAVGFIALMVIGTLSVP